MLALTYVFILLLAKHRSDWLSGLTLIGGIEICWELAIIGFYLNGASSS